MCDIITRFGYKDVISLARTTKLATPPNCKKRPRKIQPTLKRDSVRRHSTVPNHHPSSPGLEDLISSIASLRSVINWHRQGPWDGDTEKKLKQGLSWISVKVLTVTKISNAAGSCRVVKCHPCLFVVSPAFRTLILEPSCAPKATTDTGGLPRVYSSGISVLIVWSSERRRRQRWPLLTDDNRYGNESRSVGQTRKDFVSHTSRPCAA